ncbi:MAG: RidA family protein [Candidatus Marinimicrobia bacterium]|nr:RidA family protein [Candidatus Neomarinimicrobiota bacterium]MCF7850972.1 RidA family protein [Candidatus Neomarinimicrobiota bacterium]MCF7905549.1 RidA family protein [Candidatus Neomarinimicrobiota bacterium]
MKTTISTDKAPAAIGPYNQAVEINGLIYTAGQIPLDPATGKLVDTSFTDRVHQVMQNLQGILEAAGSDFSKVVKTTIFVTDLGQYADLNSVYAEYFEHEAPARSAVQVAALPMGTDVEIEMVAHK